MVLGELKSKQLFPQPRFDVQTINFIIVIKGLFYHVPYTSLVGACATQRIRRVIVLITLQPCP